MNTEEPLAVGIAAATRLVGLSRSFIYEAMKRGELPYVRAGGRRLLIVADLRAWLAALRREGA